MGLRYANVVIEVKKVIEDKEGTPIELMAECRPLNEVEKPKGFVHWVAEPFSVDVRLYERLFIHKSPEDPSEVPGGFLSDCNLDSIRIIPNALADKHLLAAKVYDKYQFERVGFFSVDSDSSANRVITFVYLLCQNGGCLFVLLQLVFNRTVSLKEDSAKN